MGIGVWEGWGPEGVCGPRWDLMVWEGVVGSGGGLESRRSGDLRGGLGVLEGVRGSRRGSILK